MTPYPPIFLKVTTGMIVGERGKNTDVGGPSNASRESHKRRSRSKLTRDRQEVKKRET